MTNPMRPMAGIIAPPRTNDRPSITRPMAGLIAPPPKRDDNPLAGRPMSGMISTPKTDTFGPDEKQNSSQNKKELIKKVVLGALGITAIIALGAKFIKKG